MAPNTATTLTAIATNWHIRNAIECRKRGRRADEDGNEDGRATKRPSIQHEDNDARQIDDTGFLSDHSRNDDDPAVRPKKRKRLSRINQDRVRIPHWQYAIQAGEPTPLEDIQHTTTEIAAHDIQDDILPGESAAPPMNMDRDVSITMGSLDLNALRIPAGATARQRVEFHKMRRRIWYDEYMMRMAEIEAVEEEKKNGWEEEAGDT